MRSLQGRFALLTVLFHPQLIPHRQRLQRRALTDHFVQHKGSKNLDVSMLLMPLVRFVGASDPKWLSTLQAIEKTLVRDGMVFRYRNDDTYGDGLDSEEGAFVACSYWYVECLARAGRVEQAHLEFEQLLRYANPLGLRRKTSRSKR